MKAFFQFLTTLAVNAVPAIGWFFEGWNSGTTLAVYWFENVAATFFIAGRILIHRRLVPCRGHFKFEPRKDAKRTSGGSFLSSFLMVSLVFSAGHGFFLGMLVFVLTQNGHAAEVGLDWTSILRGCGGVLVFLTIGFFMDLPGLRNKSFFWIEQMGDRHLARVIIVHLSLIFGLFAVAMTNATKAFFAVFVGFKTLNDLSTVLPQWDPEEPPRWLCWVMDKIPADPKSVRKNETFAEFWKRDKADEITRRRQNEHIWTER